MPDTQALDDTDTESRHAAKDAIDAQDANDSKDEVAQRFPAWSSPRSLAIAALVLAIVGVAVGVTALFDPLHHPSYSGQQTNQAKTHVCAAYTVVREGVVVNTHLVNPNPEDPAAELAVAANARLALLGGGAFLRDRLAAEPATPAEVATTAAALANTIEELGAAYLAGSDTPLAPLRRDLDGNIAKLNKLCA